MPGPGASIGFTTSSGKSTGRTGSSWDPAKFAEFVKTIHQTLGGPFTIGDLATFAPRSQSLFGGEPTSMTRPGGGFNLGFGPPPGYTGFGGGGGTTGGGGGTDTSPGGTDAGPAPAPSGGGTDTTPGGDNARLFNMSDLSPAWQNDPEKQMDLPRFFRQSGLDPNGFTLTEYQDAIRNLGRYGFSGRSSGNFNLGLSLLQNRTTVGSDLGGGRGSGVF